MDIGSLANRLLPDKAKEQVAGVMAIAGKYLIGTGMKTAYAMPASSSSDVQYMRKSPAPAPYVDARAPKPDAHYMTGKQALNRILYEL